MARLFEERPIRYRDGNKVSSFSDDRTTLSLSHRDEVLPRLTLGQLTRHLVNHKSVMDHVDVLAEMAYRDAQRAMRLHQRHVTMKLERE